jgi:DNA repair protein SbcC/Rad50
MRPHRLRVTAFGAFAGPVEVCFDDLASSGLFLLHGETGAGKTTLLDAIGFALYGRVPGERGKARRLRSDHAAPGTRTEVQLEATIGGRRMRITRRPEQARPKLRGGGTTTEQAKVLLEESGAAGWRAVSTRAGEADEEIKDLMGMSADQFFQVVLLPQGQFAQFLHAPADDRARLLQKLFGTDRFRAVEDWLANRRRETARLVDEAELAIKELAARVAQVAHPDHADHADQVDQGADAAWAARLAEAATAQSAAAAAVVAVRGADLDRALDRQGNAVRLAERQRRRRDALRARDELGALQPGVDALRIESAAATRAAELRHPLDEAERTSDVLTGARDADERARAEAVRLGAAATATAAELRADALRHVVRSGQLEELRSVVRQAAGEEELAGTARRAAAALAAQI